MMINLGSFRMSAREALKKNLPVALLITLLSTLPSLCLQVAANLSMNPLMKVLVQYQYADMNVQVLGRIFRALSQNLSPEVRLLWIMVPVLFLMLPFLSLGRHWFSLQILRGKQGQIQDMLARIHIFFKALGLHVVHLVAVILWGLPGMMVMLLGSVIALRSGNVSVFSGFYSFGMIVTAVLCVRATLMYQMADIELADHPQTGIIEAMRHSREHMKGLKFALLMLMISFIGYLLLAEIVTSLLSDISYAAAMVVSIGLSLMISCYMETAVCAFYEMVDKMHSISEADSQVE